MNAVDLRPLPPQPAAEKRRSTIQEVLPSGRVSHIPPGYLTMTMIRHRTGMTKGDVFSLISRGLLKSERRNDQGWRLYRESDVDALAQNQEAAPMMKTARPEKLYAAVVGGTTVVSREESQTVFRLLHEGKNAVEVVLTTGYHPTVVMTIMRDYNMFAESIIVSKKLLEEINKLNLECEMPIESGEQILTALRSAAREHLCTGCTRRPRSSMCKVCVAAVVQTRAFKKTGKVAREAVREPISKKDTESEISD